MSNNYLRESYTKPSTKKKRKKTKRPFYITTGAAILDDLQKTVKKSMSYRQLTAHTRASKLFAGRDARLFWDRKGGNFKRHKKTKKKRLEKKAGN